MRLFFYQPSTRVPGKMLLGQAGALRRGLGGVRRPAPRRRVLGPERVGEPAAQRLAHALQALLPQFEEAHLNEEPGAAQGPAREELVGFQGGRGRVGEG